MLGLVTGWEGPGGREAQRGRGRAAARDHICGLARCGVP